MNTEFFTLPRDLARVSTVPVFWRQIERFFSDYLVSGDGPVPFGGRDAELACLDAWLADLQAPSRLAMIAPAGRGKSALLVRWIERLHAANARELTWELAFVPVSIRFGLNAPETFLRALAERLAAIHAPDQAIARPSFDARGFYASRTRDLVEALAATDKRVLIVIDGLDEALGGDFDPSLFPGALPANIRVLISARRRPGDADAAPWIERLGWRVGVDCAPPMELAPLSETAIAGVLASLGERLAEAASDPALTRRLAELTEGEPLLMRYYAEDLQRTTGDAARLTPAALEALRPGFTAYFGRWLDLQKAAWREAGRTVDEREIDAMLALLAFAHGPLENPDLHELSARLLGAAPTFSPEAVLRPLRAFVIGDGGPGQGHVLAHPKISSHLQGERFGAWKTAIQDCFAAWGRDGLARLNDGRLAPERASPYALQFLARHFEDVNAPAEDFMALVQNGWRLAWESFEGGQRGFARDIGAAWAALRRDGPLAHLGEQTRCALALSSIKSLGSSLWPELIVEAVKAGALTIAQARHFIELKDNPTDRVEIFARLALLSSDNPAVCETLAWESFDVAASARDDGYRARLLGSFAKALFAPGEALPPPLRDALIAAALHAARGVRAPSLRAETFSALAVWLPPEVMGESLAAVRAIGSDDARRKALMALSQCLPEAYCLEAARIARHMEDAFCRASVSAALASRLPSEQKRRIIQDIAQDLDAIGDDDNRRETLEALAPLLDPESTPSETIAKALQMAEALPEPYRVQALAALSAHLPTERKPGLIAHALDVLEALKGSRSTTSWYPFIFMRRERSAQISQSAQQSRFVRDAIAAIVRLLAPAEKERVLDLILADAPTWSPDLIRWMMLSKIAQHLSERQAHEAIRLARSLQDAKYRTSAFSEFAECFEGEPRRLAADQALREAVAIDDEYRRGRLIKGLAARLSPEQLEEALRIVKAIDEPTAHAEALAALAPFLPIEQRETALAEALCAANDSEEPLGRAIALLALTPMLPTEQQRECLAAAVASAKAIHDEEKRFYILMALGRVQTGAARRKSFADALAILKTIRCESFWSGALRQLAPELSAEQLLDALDAANGLTDVEHRAEALVKLTPHLPPETRSQTLAGVLRGAQTSDSEEERSQVLVALANSLLPELDGIATAVALELTDPELRRQTLCALCKGMGPDRSSSEAIAEAVAAVLSLSEPEDLAKAIAELAPFLPPDLAPPVLEAARKLDDVALRAKAVDALSEHVTPEELRRSVDDVFAAVEAGAAALATSDAVYPLSEALRRLAPHLSTEQAGAALAIAETFADAQIRTFTFSRLALCLPTPFRAEATARALEARKAIDDRNTRGQTIAALTPLLSPSQLDDAIAAVRRLGSAGVLDLARMVEHLAPDMRESVVGEVLEAMKTVQPVLRSATLLSISPYLSEAQRRQFLTIVLDALPESKRSVVLYDLANAMEAIAAASGPETLDVIYAAFTDVCAWLP